MTPTDEIQDALQRLRIAENHFAEATEPEYIDLALDEIDVAHARLRLAIRRAKAQAACEPC
jgi:hypothetical protein